LGVIGSSYSAVAVVNRRSKRIWKLEGDTTEGYSTLGRVDVIRFQAAPKEFKKELVMFDVG